MSEQTIDRVAEFMTTFNQRTSSEVCIPPAEIRKLRFMLLMEEVLEFGRAVGVVGLCESTEEEFKASIKEELAQICVYAEPGSCNLIEAADALADIDYVCQGANLVFGFPAHSLAREVHRSNMSKLGEDGKPIYNEHRKVVKGPNYFEPRIKQVLLEAGAAPALLWEGRTFGNQEPV